MNGRETLPALHGLAALVVLAAAHPVAQVLVNGPEFFVAHDLDRSGVVVLGAVLFGLLPASVWLADHLLVRVHALARLLWRWGLLSCAVLLISLQALQNVPVRSRGIVLMAVCIAGAVCLLHLRSSAVRTFVAWLAPAPLIAAFVFFSATPVNRLLTMSPPAPTAIEGAPGSSPSVVWVVFDQLPLVSLLDESGHIDQQRYPNFAALADTSTWARHAIAASDATAWALPALVSGRHPAADRLPAAVDVPNSLFTWLAPTHAMHVFEPVTALCPRDVCAAAKTRHHGRIVTLAADLAVVFGHVTLPAALTERLPRLTDDWRGFGVSFWQQRWVGHRDDDRRTSVAEWVSGLHSQRGPMLAFLHVLLPHEPFIYLPSGKRGALQDDVPGLQANGRWSMERQLVAVGHARQRMQVQLVDAFLGDIVGALSQLDLFESSLLVVTSDHGASFRPGASFKGAELPTIADVGVVPLFIKQPHQREGHVIETLVGAVDALPTVAGILRRDLPWDVAGRNILGPVGPATDDEVKCVHTDRARRSVCADLRTVRGGIEAALHNRALLDAVLAHAIVDTPVSAAVIQHDADLRIRVDGAAVLGRDVADFAPAFVSGVVQRTGGPASSGTLVAVAVDGVVRATATVLDERETGRPGYWATMLPPDVAEGAADVSVFVVARDDPLTLVRPSASDAEDATGTNLIDPHLQVAQGIHLSGFHDVEWVDGQSFRWTNGEAAVNVPPEAANEARTLRVVIRMGGHPTRPFAIRANGCTLFEGHLPEGRWTGTFPLDPCLPAAGRADDGLTISISSEPFNPGTLDARNLGVAVDALVLRGDNAGGDTSATATADR